MVAAEESDTAEAENDDVIKEGISIDEEADESEDEEEGEDEAASGSEPLSKWEVNSTLSPLEVW